MRTATALLLFFALFVSLGPVIQPAVARVPQAMRASCCVEPAAGHEQGGCGKETPKSKEHQQCCVACNLGLALALAGPLPSLAPPAEDESFADLIFCDRSRTDRPPTPPPRGYFS